MKSHYRPYQKGRSGGWWFTSPLGTHGEYATSVSAWQGARMMRARHLERSGGHGVEASLLRAYFNPEPAEA